MTLLTDEPLAATDPPADRSPPRQRSFDDLGTPLVDVTFCVVDLETTGGSARDCAITEIGAVKLLGGACLGTFQTMVNPGQAIPPEITVLTGITEAMVYTAPRIEAVLPTFDEFVGDAVIVGHNVRFDLGFLRAAYERDQRAALANRSVDTCALARRLVRDEVPNCKLSTLARCFRLDHQPSHRALDDALATGDLLHTLLERAGRMGVVGLDDLLALPKINGHEQAAKLRLTEQLPRRPGVYMFRDRRGEVLYVGKATNLRTRVRSYFSGDQRRKITQLLRETVTIDHTECAHPLEAAVREVRLIHEHEPRYNRQAKTWRRYTYLKLTLNERFPRLSVVRVARDDGGFYLGPLTSARAAKRIAEAIESVVPLRRCTQRPGSTLRSAPCASAQLGVSTCPCAGTISEGEYQTLVSRTLRALTREPELLLAPLDANMRQLAREQRFEEAVDVRERAAALARALRRQHRANALRSSGAIRLRLTNGSTAELVAGRLVASAPADTGDRCGTGALPFTAADHVIDGGPDETTNGGFFTDPAAMGLAPLPRESADELACVAQFLDREASSLVIEHCTNGLAEPLPRIPSFEAAKSTTTRRGR